MAALVTLSENIANMVILGVHSFRVRYCPSYYQCFLDTIKDILEDMIITEANQKAEAKQIFESLQRRQG
jgi:hypothetical protein